MRDKMPFVWWFLVMCCTAVLCLLAQHHHLWALMDAKDVTKITWVTLAVSSAASLVIGACAYRGRAATDTLNRLWFLSDAMVTLGMIGTVAGFLIMLGDDFNKLNAADTASVQRMIQTVGSGMGTILVTTLMGLVASLWLKLQLVIIDHEE